LSCFPHFPRDSSKLLHPPQSINNPSPPASNPSPLDTKVITMASSLRMAAPKMAQMAAQSSVKVARSPMMAQKFTRAYSGKLH
jgi:hypothetical protein